MTELNPPLTYSMPGGIADATADAPPVFVPYWKRIVRLTFAGWGAWIGLTWILVITFLAAFAPLLANSHPLAMRENGRWSAPFLKFLTPTDVVLQIAFWAAVILLLLRRTRPGVRWSIFGILIALTIALSAIFVHAPDVNVYETYRKAINSGQITSAIYSPIRFSPDDHQREITDARLLSPSSAHWMGSSADAADVTANMIYATRTALSIGFVATGVAVFLGVIMGGVMGYFGGWIDLVGMRIVEIFESVPTFLLLLAFAEVFHGWPILGLYVMMAVIGFFNSFSYAEFVRAEFLSLRDRDFVQSARSTGLPLRSVLFRHMLPNALTPVIVNASFGVASAILIEASLSFLGVGLQTEASWGSLLEQAIGAGGEFYWWLGVFPGAAIFLTVLAYNLIGESLRDALDPKLNKME